MATQSNGNPQESQRGIRFFRIPSVQEALAKGLEIQDGRPMPQELDPDDYGRDARRLIQASDFVSILRQEVDPKTGEVLGVLPEEKAREYAARLAEYGLRGNMQPSRSGNSWTIWKESGAIGYDAWPASPAEAPGACALLSGQARPSIRT